MVERTDLQALVASIAPVIVYPHGIQAGFKREFLFDCPVFKQVHKKGISSRITEACIMVDLPRAAYGFDRAGIHALRAGRRTGNLRKFSRGLQLK